MKSSSCITQSWGSDEAEPVTVDVFRSEWEWFQFSLSKLNNYCKLSPLALNRAVFPHCISPSETRLQFVDCTICTIIHQIADSNCGQEGFCISPHDRSIGSTQDQPWTSLELTQYSTEDNNEFFLLCLCVIAALQTALTPIGLLGTIQGDAWHL